MATLYTGNYMRNDIDRAKYLKQVFQEEMQKRNSEVVSLKRVLEKYEREKKERAVEYAKRERELHLLSLTAEELQAEILLLENELEKERERLRALSARNMEVKSPAYKKELDTQEMIRLHSEGYGIGFISNTLGCHVDTVRNRLKREGIY